MAQVPSTTAAYDQKRQATRTRSAMLVAAGQDIAPIPPVRNPARRMEARQSFRRFCEIYYPHVFDLAWSDDHLRVIDKIERVVRYNQMFAVAMPRGSGKTTLCQISVIWAILTGRHKFVVLLAATEADALGLLSNVKKHLAGNEKLLEDYPEAVYPIRKLEGETRRCVGQRCYGQPTHIGWSNTEIVMPTIAGSSCSGAIIRVSGITGKIRGALYVRSDGDQVRPSLVILDDPQTDGSARSPLQTTERLNIINGAICGLSGPGKRTAIIIPCTVIRPGDLADQILDTQKHPEWNGERTKMVYSFPDNEPLWEEYAALRSAGLRRGDGSDATEFYRRHRAAMDAGSKVSWPARYPDDCISALQHAMNLKLRDEAAFFAEYQNEPLISREEEDMLTSDQIAAKLNRRAEGAVPATCTKLAMYIDVQKKLLYYVVIAFEPNFTCYVLEYGAWPDPHQHHFLYRECRKTLLTTHRGHGEEAAILAGLEELTAAKLGRAYTRDDKVQMRIGVCLIDSGYQTPTVEQFCRQTRYAGIVLPAKGQGITASGFPLDERKPRRGEEVGDNWRISVPQGPQAMRLVRIDTNHWKSFLHARLSVPMGDSGCLSLWGNSEARHRMISEHLTSEYRVRTEGRGRKVDEWKEPPHKPDNHLFDCAVGCMVGASILGCRLLAKLVPAKKAVYKRKKVKARYL